MTAPLRRNNTSVQYYCEQAPGQRRFGMLSLRYVR